MFTREEAYALMKEAEAFEFELKMMKRDDDVTMMELTESERSAIGKISRFDADTVYTREEAYALLELVDGLERMTLLGGNDVVQSAIDKVHKYLEQMLQPVQEKSFAVRLEDLKELENELQSILDSDLPTLERFERISFLKAVLLKEHRLPPSQDTEQEKLDREIESLRLKLAHSCPDRYYF